MNSVNSEQKIKDKQSVQVSHSVMREQEVLFGFKHLLNSASTLKHEALNTFDSFMSSNIVVHSLSSLVNSENVF